MSRAEAAGAKSRIDGWLREDQGRQNAESGRAHPALVSLLRRADEAFAPIAEMIPKQRRHPGAQVLRAYRAAIEAENKLTIPLPTDPDRTGGGPRPASILDGQRQVDEGVAASGGEHLATTICLRASPGRTAVVERVVSSSIKRLDREALDAMDRALRASPMPDDLPSTQVCYRFDVDIGRILPASYLPCLVTGLLDGFKCVRRGGEWLRHAVKLAQVWIEK
jgi:hypothetical protein